MKPVPGFFATSPVSGGMCNKQAGISSSVERSLSHFLVLMLFRVEKPRSRR